MCYSIHNFPLLNVDAYWKDDLIEVMNCCMLSKANALFVVWNCWMTSRSSPGYILLLLCSIACTVTLGVVNSYEIVGALFGSTFCLC